MKWAYGITTVPSRATTTLPRTLASLKESGFGSPHLFIDELVDRALPTNTVDWRKFNLPFTLHIPQVHEQPNNLGNWYLAAWELYLRNPSADYYALFEDDIVLCRNVQSYLNALPLPQAVYWNLYLAPNNASLDHAETKGFAPSRQKGKGALALVFGRKQLTQLFKQDYYVDYPASAMRKKSLDGTILNALRTAGIREHTHYPSLVLHTGDVSSLKHGKFGTASTFLGESYDAMELLK